MTPRNPRIMGILTSISSALLSDNHDFDLSDDSTYNSNQTLSMTTTKPLLTHPCRDSRMNNPIMTLVRLQNR